MHVQRFPLAMLDAASVSSDDLVTFEIRYADRVGAHYFALRTACYFALRTACYSSHYTTTTTA